MRTESVIRGSHPRLRRRPRLLFGVLALCAASTLAGSAQPPQRHTFEPGAAELCSPQARGIPTVPRSPKACCCARAIWNPAADQMPAEHCADLGPCPAGGRVRYCEGDRAHAEWPRAAADPVRFFAVSPATQTTASITPRRS